MRFRSLPILLAVSAAGALFSGCGTGALAPVPARDVLLSGQAAPQGYGAYGYVIFTERPSDKNLDRYLAMGNAYLRHLEPVARYGSPPASWIMPTFWLAGKDFNPYRKGSRIWIDQYDYARAKAIASSVNALSSQGPLLVAWNQPFEDTAAGEKALVLDLSGFSNEDLDRGLRIWKDKITQDPKLWKDGLNLLIAREAFRNFLERYGDKVINAVEKVKGVI